MSGKSFATATAAITIISLLLQCFTGNANAKFTLNLGVFIS